MHLKLCRHAVLRGFLLIVNGGMALQAVYLQNSVAKASAYYLPHDFAGKPLEKPCGH